MIEVTQGHALLEPFLFMGFRLSCLPTLPLLFLTSFADTSPARS